MKQSSGSEPAAARPRYDGGWRIAVVYFGLVSLGFAQPMFDMIMLFRRSFRIEMIDVITIIIVFQYLTAAALTGLRALLKKPGLRLALDCLVAAGAALMLLRQAQMTYAEIPFSAFSDAVKIGIVIGLAAVLISAVFFLRRFLVKAAFYAGLVSPLFGVLFAWNIANHELPLKISEARESKNKNAPGVIVAVMDQFSMEIVRTSEGRIDKKFFPNLARLAARGIHYSNAITNYGWTRASLPSFLTSQFNIGGEISNNVNLETLSPANLFDIFRNEGYAVNIYGSYYCGDGRFHCTTYLDAREPWFLVRVFANFISEFGPDSMVGRFLPMLNGDTVKAENAKLVQAAAEAGPGDFYFLHMMGSHHPYAFNPDGGYKFITQNHWFRPGMDFDAFAALYHDQMRYLDTVIGEMLDAVDSRPPGRPLIFMLTSDHGECWSDECPGRLLARTNPGSISMISPSLVNVPAILMTPFHPPRRDEGDYQSIDLLPTLCEAAGLKGCGDYEFDGVSRLSGPPPPRPRQFILSPHHDPADIPLPARPVPAPPFTTVQID